MTPGKAMGAVDSANSFCLQVADVRILVRSGQAGPTFRIEGPSQKFLVNPEIHAEVTLDVSWGDLTLDTPGPLVFDSGGTWRLHEEPDGRLGFRFFSSNTGSSPYLVMRLASDARTGTLTLHEPFYPPDAPLDPLQFPVDEVLMVQLLGHGLGVELHACGVVAADGKGYLFAGQSGDGKTTTARLWDGRPGVRLLSDDRIVVRREGDGFVMYGTPWHGEADLAESLKAPLDAIFFLERGLENRIVPLSTSAAAAELVARSFVPFHDAKSVEQTLGFLGDLAAGVPCARLAFVPDEALCDFVTGLSEDCFSTVALS